MKHLRVMRFLPFLMCVMCLEMVYAQGGSSSQKDPNWYLAERVLAGLKLKLTKNFTVGAWASGSWGATYYPDYSIFDPSIFQGYDVVPGFEVAIGKLFANVNLSLGGDYYYMYREYYWNDEPDQYHSRARGNIILTTPFAGKFTLQFIQRFEQILQRKKQFGVMSQDPITFIRKRSMLKVSGPQFTKLKISPYAYYEGFKHPYDPYCYEAEFGASFSPIKNFSMSLADQIQSQPALPRCVTHQISLYFFYTIDLSQ